MKKFIFLLLSIIFLISFVSSRPIILDQFVGGVADVLTVLKDILKIFITPFFGESEFLFEIVLLSIIIFCLIYFSLDKSNLFENNPKLVVILAIIVSLLATKFLSQKQFLDTIILPYTILGITLSAGLPVIIYFFFAESFEQSGIRKILWVLFGVIFLGIGYSRYPDLGNLAWIYFFTAIISLLFFIFDGTIRRFLVKQRMEQLGIRSRDSFTREIRRDMVEIDRDLRNGVISESEHRRMKNDLKKQLKALIKK